RLQRLPLCDGGPGRRGAPDPEPCEPAAAVAVPVAAARGPEPDGGDGVVRRRDRARRAPAPRRLLRVAARRLGRVSRGLTRTWRERHGARSARSASPAARAVHRRRHAQHHHLPGDTEMKRIPALLLASLLAASGLAAQGTVSPGTLLRPLAEEWPMYNGDYTGRRFSALSTVDTSNVSALT